MLDIHNHSKFSFDSVALPEDEINKAKEKGIKIYGFAEHVYLRENTNFGNFISSMREYVSYIDGLKPRYPNVKLLHGAEYNYLKGLDHSYESISDAVDLDYVINSVHWVNGEDMYKDYFDGKTVDLAYNLYFDEVLRSLDAEYDYQIVGHFGVALKIGKHFTSEEYYKRYLNRISEVLSEIIKRGKVLEINTSAGSEELSVPSMEVVELYYRLGGRKISFGADAHKVQSVAKNIDLVTAAVKMIGFRFATYYQNKREEQYLL